ncbi:MAG: hypothetical protein ACKO2P_14835 [Planctomycetota bacterium]
MDARFPPVFACVVLLSLCGCGDSTAASATQVASAETAFDVGRQAFQTGDFAAAETQLNAAVTAGTLQADLFESALVLLVRSRIAQGKLDDADAGLKQLESTATAIDQYWVAMAELLLKKNDAAGARRAVQEARKANPKAELPGPLRTF